MSPEVRRTTKLMYGTCFRKKRFGEIWQANGARKRLLRDEGIDVGTPYACRYCKGWHLGHKGWGE